MRFRRVPAGALDRRGRTSSLARRRPDPRERRVIRDFLAAWRRRDRAELSRLFAPDGKAVVPDRDRPLELQGRDAFLAFVDRAMASDRRIFEVAELDSFTGTEQVAVLLTAADGDATWMTVYRVAGEQVVEIHVYADGCPSAMPLAS
jgi:ketosteroid isomerase-like protein